MLLSPLEAELFFRLHRTLMFFINQRLKVLGNTLATPEEFAALSPELRSKVSDAFVKHLDLLDAFIQENPGHLREDELDIVRSWQHLVVGKFYIFRELANYTVFLSTDKKTIAYGVVALTQPFEEMIGPYLPVLVKTILLPFRDKIIYEGLLNSYNISFGGGIRRSLDDSYKDAKARDGIVTLLPISEKPTVALAKKPRAKARRQSKLSGNILAAVPTDLPDELVQTLLRASGIRIERIVSQGHASPKGFWYDQETHEWILLVAGAARLQLEGKESVNLEIGSFINIPAHQRHRVEWTDPAQPTIWLAIHYSDSRT